ncbi:MAG: PIN domain-containing protein [Casimicrobiaceae bacterium]|nr:PIN domain-containing protein [Casimicrobiaceae bacterium]MDW8311955.1 PIN domain-containing protein [Burkholderiales bacterium]
MRIFLDANILFSAAKSDGAVRVLLHRLLEQGHVLVADAYVIAEARRNLMAKGPAALADFAALLPRLTVIPHSASVARNAAEVDWLPAKDRPVLAAAIHARCDALVTGDRTHLGSAYGRVIHGVTIHSPRSLAERVLR